MPEVNMETMGDKKVLTATFDTLGGANLAVQKLQDLENKDLLSVEDTLTVSKNAWDKLDVHETTGDSAKKGAGVGALVGAVVGLIFPPSILATTALGAAVGAMTGVLRDSTFDDSYVKGMGEELQPGQSMLIAVVDPQWEDEIQSALDGVATRIGWTAMDRAAASAAARQGTKG
jgi:uncharacterized membrane protein